MKLDITLESSNYGVDIFLDGKYITTIQTSEPMSKEQWLIRGVKYIAEHVNQNIT